LIVIDSIKFNRQEIESTYTSRAKEAFQHFPRLSRAILVRSHEVLPLLVFDLRLHHAVVVGVSGAAETLAVGAVAEHRAFILPSHGEVDAFAEA
jgi:hypothetical protein